MNESGSDENMNESGSDDDVNQLSDWSDTLYELELWKSENDVYTFNYYWWLVINM